MEDKKRRDFGEYLVSILLHNTYRKYVMSLLQTQISEFDLYKYYVLLILGFLCSILAAFSFKSITHRWWNLRNINPKSKIIDITYLMPRDLP